MRNPIKFRPDLKKAKLGDSVIFARGKDILRVGTIESLSSKSGNLVARVRIHKSSGNEFDSRAEICTTFIGLPIDGNVHRLSATLLIVYV